MPISPREYSVEPLKTVAEKRSFLRQQLLYHQSRSRELKRELKLLPKSPPPLDLPGRLALPLAELFGEEHARTVNALEERGMFYVRDLLQRTVDDLQRIPNFGPTTIAVIFDTLASIGLVPRRSNDRREGQPTPPPVNPTGAARPAGNGRRRSAARRSGFVTGPAKI